MALLLRKVDKRRWDWGDGDIPWLPAGEFPAAPLADLRASVESEISVWQVEEDKSNLMWVVAGLAATLNHLDKFDYTLFAMDLLGGVGIQANATRGESADARANEEWHRDLVELSSSKLVMLARLIHRHGELGRFLEGEVKDLIKQAVGAGRINKTKLKERLRGDVFAV